MSTKHVEIDLTDGADERGFGNPHRPVVNVYMQTNEDDESLDEPRVIVHLHAMWGQPNRWLEMTAEEARRLAKQLLLHASMIEPEPTEIVIEWNAVKEAAKAT